MSGKNKFIAICCFLLGAGIIITVIGFSLGGIVLGVGFTNHGLQVNSPALRDEPEYESADITLDSFESIDLSVVDADIEILESDHYGISYQVLSTNNFSYEVKDNKLKILQSYKKSGTEFNYMFFGVNLGYTGKDFKKVFITVSVPENASLDTVSIFNDYGDVKLSDINSASISLEADSGNIEVSDITANSIEIDDDYGDIDLINITSPVISLNASSGNIKLEYVETEQLNVIDDYGDLDMEQVVLSDADITLGSGSIEMLEVSGSTLKLYNNYGSLDMKQVNISDADITLDSGTAKMNEVTGSTFVINNGYGDVTGDIVSIDNAIMKLQSGNLKINNFTVEQVDIISEYGSVTMDITTPVDGFEYDLFTDYGSIEINNKDMGDTYRSLQTSDGVNPLIKISCESGDININNR